MCLAHLIRAAQYAGDAVLGPGLTKLLKRACAIGRRRADFKNATLKTYEANLERRLNRLWRSIPPTGPASSSSA